MTVFDASRALCVSRGTIYRWLRSDHWINQFSTKLLDGNWHISLIGIVQSGVPIQLEMNFDDPE
jgi:hypothetical protein